MILPQMEKFAMASADAVYAIVPRPQPARARLRDCRLIAHRGAHDNRTVIENTVHAFDAALAAGVWGIETDVRWTRDLEPVLIHDADTARLFGTGLRIADVTADELRRRIPSVPTLAELVQRHAPRLHLMLELKAELYPDPARQQQRLAEILQPLQAGRDYHFMALDAALFEPLAALPNHAMIPIARTNVAATCRIALERGYAGVAGHYALIGSSLIERHKRAGQSVGVGFPSSRFGLYRELNRDIRWIFSDHAVKLQRFVASALEVSP